VTCETYRGVAFRYGSLSALLGLFFAWLLSFPLLGPSLYAFAETRGMDAASIGAAFSLFHGLGLVGYGIWGRRFLVGLSREISGEEEMRLTDSITGEGTIDIVVMGLSCLICFGLTVAFVYVPYRVWPWLALLLGLISGAFVVTCAKEMARTIPRNELGRGFALSMAIANIALYIHTAFLVHLEPLVTVSVSSVWLLVAFLAVCRYGMELPATGSGSRMDYEKAASGEKRRLRMFFLALAVVLTSTSIIGGFAHGVVLPSLAVVGILDRFYNVVPYILMCFLCGWMADFVGRRHVANMGFICLGLSMPLLSLLPLSGIPGYLIAQTLIQGGYACIDVFLWVSLADIASEDRVSTYYGIGLGLNVWLIFFGILFVERFLPIGEVGFSNISLVATLILFFGVIGLVRLEETLTYEGATVQGIGTAAAIHKDRPTTEDFGASRALSSTTGLSSRKKSSHQVEAVIDHYVLNLMAAEYSLTRRELEVVVLLLKGMTNDEIEERLCISEGTLKTHIRHVFQKLDISNRKELLVSFTRFLASSEEADRKTDLH
jgi:DNA-binding CsgD family transcriptional regulator